MRFGPVVGKDWYAKRTVAPLLIKGSNLKRKVLHEAPGWSTPALKTASARSEAAEGASKMQSQQQSANAPHPTTLVDPARGG